MTASLGSRFGVYDVRPSRLHSSERVHREYVVKSVRGDSMSSQSLKNLTIFNFAQIFHANSHPREKQLRQILEKLVKYFARYDLPKN